MCNYRANFFLLFANYGVAPRRAPRQKTTPSLENILAQKFQHVTKLGL